MPYLPRIPALLMFLAFITTFGSADITAQVTREWTNSEPGFRAVAVDIDDQGFVYVTGLSPLDAAHNFRHDIVTVKYDRNGNRIWKREFDETDDGTFGDDTPNWLTLDPEGNVIVAGRSFINSTGDDIIVIKYDPDGNLLWKTRTTQGIEPNRVGTDADGNIFVTGKNSDSSSRDYITVKYASDGNQLWFRTYNGPNNFTDEAAALAVTSSGDVVVTGESTGGVTCFDMATIYYESDGTERWVQRFASPPSCGHDEGKDIALGPNGEIYVFGVSDNGSNIDFTLIRYDQNGNEIWVETYNDPSNRGEIAHRMAVDSQGDIVVTGVNGISDVLTLKYDPSGNLLWNQTFSDPTGEATGRGITTGPDDAVYVTGEANSRVLTIKYDANGNEVWNDIYDSPGSPDRGYNVAVDPVTNAVAVAAQSPILTVYYTQTGGNQPPTATITDPEDGATFSPGAVVNFAGDATDPEDGVLPASAFTWTATHVASGLSQVIATGVKSGCFQPPAEVTGEVEIELEVADSQGASATDVVSVFFENQPPVATITEPQEGQVFDPGDTINFAGDATDPEDGILPASAFTWTATHIATGRTKELGSGIKSGSFVAPELTGNVRIELQVVDSQGATGTDTVGFSISTTEVAAAEQTELTLHTFPNPFNPETTIEFTLPQRESVSIRIFNALGQTVRTLVDDATLAPGTHAYRWNSRNDRGTPVPSGAYYLQLQAGELQKIQKLSLVK